MARIDFQYSDGVRTRIPEELDMECQPFQADRLDRACGNVRESVLHVFRDGGGVLIAQKTGAVVVVNGIDDPVDHDLTAVPVTFHGHLPARDRLLDQARLATDGRDLCWELGASEQFFERAGDASDPVSYLRQRGGEGLLVGHPEI